MLKIGLSLALLFCGLVFSQYSAAEELLSAHPVRPAVASCHLVAHLNESKELTDAAGLQLPRWYDLHHRLLTVWCFLPFLPGKHLLMQLLRHSQTPQQGQSPSAFRGTF
jgi:hypothetical protein